MQVFRDATARRWRLVCASLVATVVATVLVARVFFGALVPTPAPNASLAAQVGFDPAALVAAAARAGSATLPPFVADRAEPPPPAAAAPSKAPFAARFGWVDPDEAPAIRALERHGRELTDVVIAGLHVAAGGLVADDRAAVLAIAREEGLRVHERVDALAGGAPLAELVTALGRDELAATRFVSALAARLDADRADGVVFDLPDDPADPDGAAREAIVRAAKARLGDKTVSIAIGPGVAADALARAGQLGDRVLLRAHVGAYDLAAPAPPSPRSWLRETIAAALELVGPDKLVVTLPTRASACTVRAADLSVTDPPPRELDWADLMARSRLAGTRPSWDDASGNLVVVLPGARGVASSELVAADGDDRAGLALVAWMLDAATFADGLEALRRYGLASVGIDDLGGEDPRIWRVLSAPPERAPLEQALGAIPRPDGWSAVGEGVELRVLVEERDGEASVALADDGGVVRETYRALPASITAVHRGRVRPGTVALTFDDGPDPEFTPKVLDVLGRLGVKATFFLIGSRVEREPELVRRIEAEGHELGNHSFSHADLSRVARRRADLELTATNLLFQATTGRTTTLFRPPYRADDTPADLDDVAAVEAGQRNGLSTIGSTIDTRDWDGATAEQIADAVVSGVERDGGGVVLMHDGGGNRSATVAALEPMITTLRARGVKLVQMRDVFGGRPLSLVNPAAPFRFEQQLSRVVWAFGTWFLRLIRWTALAALVLTIARVGALVVLALADVRRYGRDGDARLRDAARAAVSVVVPAYNEAKVIRRTIDSVLSSEGVDVEVIVLDDGSKDDTGDVVATSFLRDERVRLVRLPNGGKAAALNLGFRLASHPIVVALDADTIFLEGTILELVKRFEDPRVGAVAGRAVVGNPRGTIARWQALEYVIGQAVERRAWHALGVVSVVPGAVGAWKRDAVLEAGGFARDTLAEDTDLTLDLQVRGYRVDYAPDAVALTFKAKSGNGYPADIPVCALNGAFFWTADMDVDCDGLETATCNGNTDPWFQNDTSLHDSKGNPLDAASLPYVVVPLPSSRFDYKASGVELGSVVAVIYGDRVVYGVFGDEGPSTIIGEASHAMASALGIDPDPATGGVDCCGVTYIVFPGAAAVVDPPEDHAAATALGTELAAQLLAGQ